MRALPIFVGSLLVSARLDAQTPPPMVTDRPDQTESAVIVPRGMVQLETGASFARVSEPIVGASSDRDVVNYGATLARIGILPRLEARLGFAGYFDVQQAGALAESGVGDLDVGVKVQLAPGEGKVPQVAVIGSVILPTSAEQLGVQEVSGTVRLAFAHELTERLGLGWNIGAVVERGDGTTTDILYTATLGYAAANRVGLFVESFGFFAASELRADRHLLDAGITLAVMPNVQLDASGGIGLNSAATDWFVGAGLSVRVPK